MSPGQSERGTIDGGDASHRRAALAGALAEAGCTCLEIVDATGRALLHARSTDLPGEIARRADRCEIHAAHATIIRVTPEAIAWNTQDAAIADAFRRAADRPA
jgi:hypothetical protein